MTQDIVDEIRMHARAAYEQPAQLRTHFAQEAAGSEPLRVLIPAAELSARLSDWQESRPAPKYSRGYYRLYIDHVTQADQGCDLDFLTGASGSVVERESH